MTTKKQIPPKRISVIIPAFNNQEGVDRCLKAILDQEYPPASIEIIVVDNGSEVPIAVKYSNLNIKLIECTKPGSYSARNAGIKYSRNEIIAFIDADCWPERKWVLNGVSALIQNDNSVIGGDVTFVEEEKGASSVALYQLITGFGQKDNITANGFSATANLFCKRSHFDRIGLFDERLLSGGDREWCWRAAKNGINVHYEKNAIIYTNPRNSLSGAIRQARRVAAGRKMISAMNLAHLGNKNILKKRSAFQSIAWIFTRKELKITDRVRVFFVATVIHLAALFESIKLTMGSKAERE